MCSSDLFFNVHINWPTFTVSYPTSAVLTTRRYCQHTIAAIFCAELKLEPPCSLMARLTDRDKVDYLPVDWDDLAALFDMIAFPKDSDE